MTDEDTDTNTTRLHTKASVLKESVDIVSRLVDECKIRLHDDALTIEAVDPAKVGMVDLSVPADAFEAYEGDGQVIGINLDRLGDILGMADSDDVAELEIDWDTNKLEIQIDGLRYNLALIDADAVRQEPDVPDLDLSGEVQIRADEIQRGIRAATMVSDHLTLGIVDEGVGDGGEETFYMEAEDDTDDVRVDLSLHDDGVGGIEGEARSMFSLDYLDDMVGGIHSDARVRVVLGDDYPCKMHFTPSHGYGDVTYLVAPRIENE